jgi:erythrocyte band 7 integral membrane protein
MKYLFINVQVLSRDSVTVSVEAVVYYRVSNPTLATNNIEDYRYRGRF